jgi:putative hemolysin
MINFLILFVLLALSAFFSAAEVAFVSLTAAKVETMLKRKLPRSKLIHDLKKNPRRVLVTILIGNNLVNIGSASFATVVAADYFASAVIGITTGIMTLLVLIFGEIIPKSYATTHNKRFAIFAAPYLKVLQLVLLPVIVIFEGLTILFAGRQTEDAVSEEELRALAATALKQGAIEDDERAMLERLFKFNDINAHDIMTPRVKCVYLDSKMTIEEASRVVENNPHTRFPVVDGSPDNMIGFAHSRDLLISFANDKEKKSIQDIMHPILRIPKQMLLDDVLQEFQKTKTHIAVVFDEFGGTEGIITLEDVLEELVGEIADEHDVDDNVIKRIDKNTILASAHEELRDINDFLNVNIPGDPYDTVAEIFMDHIKKAPRKNMELEFDGVRIRIESTKKRAIEHVEIKKI